MSNVVSMFGLHRRLRAASVGHLATVEVTSSLPCRKYVQGIERLGLAREMADYFDEHVEADAVHEHVATRDICAALVEREPALVEDVFFGAAVCLLVDRLHAEHLLGAWEQGGSSLRPAALPARGAVASRPVGRPPSTSSRLLATWRCEPAPAGRCWCAARTASVTMMAAGTRSPGPWWRSVPAARPSGGRGATAPTR
jgi:hypothetical protein